jgi:hypothetical protein
VTPRFNQLVISREKGGSTAMRKTRKSLFGVLATVLMAAVAFSVPAGSAMAASDGSGSPSAAAAAKKCKRGYVWNKKKRKCVRKRAPGTAPGTSPGTSPGAAWAEGRWSGNYAESGVRLLFNVSGGRLYTGGFDDFFVHATCSDGGFDPVAVSPVQASIASNGNFTGSGVFSPGFGQQRTWHLSGHIAGRSITGGVFTVDPYNYFGSGVVCGGTTHFTAQWFGTYTF